MLKECILGNTALTGFAGRCLVTDHVEGRGTTEKPILATDHVFRIK